jgi:hypothetical protein
MKNDTIARLTKYADHLRQRLADAVPPKHAHRPDIFKAMIQHDLNRTLAKIEKYK